MADKSGDAFLRMVNRTTLAGALHQAGRLEESTSLFREAEAMQAQRQPSYPRLYSLQGYRYCDLLLSRAMSPDDGREVCERASEAGGGEGDRRGLWVSTSRKGDRCP